MNASNTTSYEISTARTGRRTVSADAGFERNDELFAERADIQERIAELEAAEEPTTLQKRRLARAIRELDDVTAKIVDANYGLVRSYAKRFSAKASREDAADFESAAVVGLMRAIENYDPTLGKFSSWAFKPIMREVLRSVRETEFRTLNSGDFERRPDILKAHAALVEKFERTPTIDEVAEYASLSREQVRRVLDAPRIDSLNASLSSEDASELGDLIPSLDGDFTEELTATAFVDALALHGIPALEERELFILTRRFGLDSEPAQNLSEVGQELGMSREAVRQIEAKAISRLQHPVILRKLMLTAAA